MKSDIGFDNRESEKEILFSSLFDERQITTKTNSSLKEEVVGKENFVFVPFLDQGGFNQDYLIIKKPILDACAEKLFNGITLEIAISDNLSGIGGWANLIAVVMIEDDSWVQLNSVDLLGLPDNKWQLIQFDFPKSILGKKINLVKIVTNSEFALTGGIFFKKMVLLENLIDLNLSVDAGKFNDERNENITLQYIDIDKLNKFALMNKLENVLVISKDPEILIRDWKKRFVENQNQKFTWITVGDDKKNTLLELAEISERFDSRRILNIFDYIHDETGNSPVVKTTHEEKIKKLSNNFDLVLLEGESQFELFLIYLHQVSNVVKVGGFLAVVNSGKLATSSVLNFFNSNRNREYIFVSNEKDKNEYMIWQRAMFYDPRMWDHFVDF